MNRIKTQPMILFTIFLSLVLAAAGCKSLEKAPDTTLTIVHTNDSHGRIKEGKYDGMGFAKITTYINGLRQENQNLLVIDAGDTFHGTTFASLSKGKSVLSLLNTIGYDAMTPGNHDFNYGYGQLEELARGANFPIIASNITKDGSPVFTEYEIIDKGGLKIGIFGLATPETIYKSHPDNTKGLVFEDPLKTAEKMVKKLKKKAHIIIAISHLGIDEESEVKSSDIAEQVEGIDIIIDGHSHTPLTEGREVGNTLVVQSSEHTKYLGIATLTYENGKVVAKSAILISKSESEDIADDEKIAGLITQIEDEQKKITGQVVGNTDVVLDGERANVRTGQTNLGTLICEAMVKRTGADAALNNGGGIRASIDEGEITRGDVITVLPFGNNVILLELSGQDIIDALENGLANYPESSGAYPQVAGLEFTIDQEAEAGSRVKDLKIAGTPVNPGSLYKLATNDFLAAGGDNYSMFKDAKVIGEFGTLDEVLIQQLQK